MDKVARVLEKNLDKAFAAEISCNPHFLAWTLSKTKFSGRNASIVLLRADEPWGAPRGEQTKFRQTDILVVCEDCERTRFGLHFENKPPGRRFDADQASDYPKRAAAWAQVIKWGSYSEWECVLLAPMSSPKIAFEERQHFGAQIYYDEIASFIPLFSL